MTVGKRIKRTKGVFFVTITCCDWIPLFKKVDGYHLVYAQFDKLKEEGHEIIGYVIMPEHLHFLIGFNACENINDRIGTSKRFLAYALVDKLKKSGQTALLRRLQNKLHASRSNKGSLHRIFEDSFDIKYCFSLRMLTQKLDYIHRNPLKRKRPLVQVDIDYLHSSARQYEMLADVVYPITEYWNLPDDLWE